MVLVEHGGKVRTVRLLQITWRPNKFGAFFCNANAKIDARSVLKSRYGWFLRAERCVSDS